MYLNMMHQINRYDLDCCVCNYEEKFENNVKQRSKYNYNNELLNNKELVIKYLSDKISPSPCDKIFRTEIIKKYVSFNEKLKIGEDILFCLNFFEKCNKAYLLKNTYYTYIQQPESAIHILSSNILNLKSVVDSIPKDVRYKYETQYTDEFLYFRSLLTIRGIHTITILAKDNDKNKVLQYLNQFYDRKIISDYIKSKYANSFIKLEGYILYILGCKAHLFFTPFYLKLRKILRRK